MEFYLTLLLKHCERICFKFWIWAQVISSSQRFYVSILCEMHFMQQKKGFKADDQVARIFVTKQKNILSNVRIIIQICHESFKNLQYCSRQLHFKRSIQPLPFIIGNQKNSSSWSKAWMELERNFLNRSDHYYHTSSITITDLILFFWNCKKRFFYCGDYKFKIFIFHHSHARRNL